MFKVSGPSFHTSSKFFDDVQYGLVDRVLWQIVPYVDYKTFFSSSMLYLAWVEMSAFTHSSSDKRPEVW